MTEAQFAQQLSYMAKACASWAGDMLGAGGPSTLDRPVEGEAVERFVAEARDRLARIEEWATVGGPPPREGIEDRLYHHALRATRPSRRFERQLSRRGLGLWRDGEMFESRWIWDAAGIDALSAVEARDLYRRILFGETEASVAPGPA